MKDEVVDRSCRQIELQRLPVRTVIKGNPRARFRAGIEQSLALGVFANGVNVRAVGEADVMGDQVLPKSVVLKT